MSMELFLYRLEGNLHTAVLCTPFFGRVARHRLVRPTTGHVKAVAHHTGLSQVVAHRFGTPLRELLVIAHTTGTVGVTHDVDPCIGVLSQDIGHVIEGITCLHREVTGVEAKGDAARHVEHDIVTTTFHIDTGTAHAVAQFLLLAVHIGTNTRPGRRAHRRANQRTVTTAGAATTGKRPCRSPYRRTNTGAGGSTRTLGLDRKSTRL